MCDKAISGRLEKPDCTDPVPMVTISLKDFELFDRLSRDIFNMPLKAHVTNAVPGAHGFTCGACGAFVSKADKFCHICGYQLTSDGVEDDG